MEHQEFLAWVKTMLGKMPHMEARESLGELIRTKGFTFLFQWKWIPIMLLRSEANPLRKVDGTVMDILFCNYDMIRIYVPEEARK